MKTSTKETNITRISRVVQFLNEHVDNTPSLQKLADVAAISPFHFHRVYRAATGETPSRTLRRLRLAKASLLLKETKKSITEIAFDVGYESSQAFAKALREVTGTTASDLRGQPDKLAATITTLSNPPDNENRNAEILDVKLVSVEPFKVIANRHIGPHEKMFGTFGTLFSWAEQTGRVAGFKGIYGIPIDDPNSVPATDCRFDCCFDLGADATPGDDYKEKFLGGGRYAVTRHRGPYEGLEEKYAYLYGPWLTKSGHTLNGLATYNHYLADPDTLPPEQWETDIYLPLDSTS